MSVGPGQVRVDRTGGRATVVWDRPPLNVFDLPLLEELSRTLRSAEVRSASVVVLKGAGHRWSAGLAVEDHLAERVDAMLTSFRRLLLALSDVPGPTVAQVEGPCLGGGLELLFVCDLAFASATARFGQPEIRLGVFPPLAAAEASRALGPKRAADLLFLGDTVPAARAESLGLVSRVFPEEAVEAEVDRLASQLGTFRPEALSLLKRAMRPEPPVLDRRLEEAEKIYLEQLMGLPASDEGLRAFLEKRPPAWPGARA